MGFSHVNSSSKGKNKIKHEWYFLNHFQFKLNELSHCLSILLTFFPLPSNSLRYCGNASWHPENPFTLHFDRNWIEIGAAFTSLFTQNCVQMINWKIRTLFSLASCHTIKSSTTQNATHHWTAIENSTAVLLLHRKLKVLHEREGITVQFHLIRRDTLAKQQKRAGRKESDS